MRLLVVDDDPLVLESCRRILAEEHEVLLARGAEEALEILEAAGRPGSAREGSARGCDLVLADLMMPARDGFSLIEEARRRWPGLPVLAMSGYDTANVQARCRALGALGFVPKPFSPDELLTAVGQVPPAKREEA